MSKFTQCAIAVARTCANVDRWMVVKKERMAMGMAIVAVFGAAAAFCAARAEQDSSGLESKLHQGQMLELTIRQEILDNFAESNRLKDREQRHLTLGQEYNEKAVKNPASAAKDQLKAEEEFAIADTLKSFNDFVAEDIRRDLSPNQKNQAVSKLVATQLRDLGFDTVWVENASIWQKLENQIHDGQGLVTRLASSVVMFVLSLVFFTFAQLSHSDESEAWQLKFSFAHKYKWKLRLTRAACLIAIGSLMVAGWRDFEAWATFGKFVVGILVLMLLGRVLSATFSDWESLRTSRTFGEFIQWLDDPYRLSSILLQKVRQTSQWLVNYLLLEEKSPEEEPGELEELERPMSPGLRMPMIPAVHRLGRIVIKLIAATAFVSAVSGLLYSRTVIYSGQAAASAFNYQAERFKTNSLDRMETYDRINELANGREYLTHFGATLQRSVLAKSNFGNDDKDDPYQSPSIIGESVSADLNGVQGADGDPLFPEQLLQPKLTGESEVLFAKGDGENEISLAWRRRAVGFLRSLTLFAIALYLFGQSLGLGRTRAAFMLSLYALALAVFGMVGPIRSWYQNSPPKDSDVLVAAAHYGAGRVSYDTQNYDRAIEEFQQAVQKRPTFVLANYYLATAHVLRSTPQQEEFISQIAMESIPEIVNFHSSAIHALTQQEFSAPINALSNLGYENVLLGFSQRDSTLGHKCVDLSLRITKQAIDRLKEENIEGFVNVHFNYALELLADGQRTNAQNAYAQGTKALRSLARPDVEAAKKTQLESAEQKEAERLVSGAISDLNLLGRYCNRVQSEYNCKKLRTDIESREEDLIEAVWGDPPKSSNAELSADEVTLIANPNGLGWSAKSPNLDFNRCDLVQMRR